MGILNAHHHGFTVSDLDRSIAFYRDALGMDLVRVSERQDLPSYDRILGYESVHLMIAILQREDWGLILELVQYVNPKAAPRSQENRFVGASHLAFQVDDIDAVFEDLQQRGYRAINPPADIDRDGRVVARAVYALDPDGISVELFQEYGDVVRS